MNIPTGHQTIMPYLIIEGAASFLEFLKTVFDANETERHMRDENLIAHAEAMIGNSTLMIADATSEFQSQPAGMFIYVPDADATYKKALENGAVSLMEPADQPYGRSGGVADKFGNTWWITTANPDKQKGQP